MSIFKHYKRIKFRPAKFKEIADEINNPERGWYQIHTFNLGEEISMKDREYTLNKTDTLAFVLIDISAYRDKDLDEEAFTNLRKIFSFFRDYRLDMIVRVVYDTVGKCLEREPDNEAQILRHMNQLGPVLGEYAGEIYVYQGLLIGNWGEMHSSKFLSPDRLKRLADVLLEQLKGTAYLAVRRPAYVRVLFPEGEDLRQSQVGIFDDAIMASLTHLGTFGDTPAAMVRRDQAWLPSEELEYVSTLCNKLPYGGEAIFSEEDANAAKMQKSLKAIDSYFRILHISYLNRVHDMRFIDNLRSLKWRGAGVFAGMNGYDYIGRHLGYRFVLRDVSCKRLKQDKSLLDWKIAIENVGFSRSFFDTKVVLRGKDELGNTKEIDISNWLQLRLAEPGKVRVYNLHTEEIYGKISLYAVKASTKRAVFFANSVNGKVSEDAEILLGKI